MNLTASHDAPRFATSVYNPGRYKYRVTPRENPEYRIDRPDTRARDVQRLILVQQFTYVGAPHIWNGDEVGMWGADDPDSRKPMLWGDLAYEDEVADPLGRPRRPDPVTPDTALLRVYRDLIALRKQHTRLFVDGSLDWLLADDARGLLAYDRTLGEARAVVAFNTSTEARTVTFAATNGAWRVAYPRAGTIDVTDGRLGAELPPRSAIVWIR